MSVTIDDLQVLLDMLKGRDDIPDEVLVQSDEGSFDEAEDLRKLSDQTLRDLRIEVPGLVIHLASTRAEAIGTPDLVQFVNREWARPRQTAERRPAAPWARRSAVYTTVICGLVFLPTVALIVQMPPIVLPTRNLVDSIALFTMSAALIGLGTLGMIATRSTNVRLGLADSYAVTKPLTKQEIRDQQSRKTSVPLWSLIVASLAFASLLTFNILNYFLPNQP